MGKTRPADLSNRGSQPSTSVPAAPARRGDEGGPAPPEAAPSRKRPRRAKSKAPAAPVAQAVALPTRTELPKKNGGVASSNWEELKKVLSAQEPFKRRRKARDEAPAAPQGEGRPGEGGPEAQLTATVAMDCEMVGVGPGGERSALARVVLVNEEGHVLLDAHVRPAEKVTDYRTAVSGVLPQHLQHAPPLAEVQARVARMLAGRVLVGHALENDLQALLLSHPRRDTRDTATYPPFMTRVGGRFKPRALRVLAREQLGLTIQEGAHSPVEDARTALTLYQRVRRQWEGALKEGRGSLAKMKERIAARGAAREGAIGLVEGGGAAPLVAAAVSLHVSARVRQRPIGGEGFGTAGTPGLQLPAVTKQAAKDKRDRDSRKNKAAVMMLQERPELYDL